MYIVEFKTSFGRDVKAYLRHGGSKSRLDEVVHLLQSGAPLPENLRDHTLLGKMRDLRELHVEHDWLLVYYKDGKKLVITCIWLVTHEKLKEREKNL
jgi:mRNA interferase YafQ